jgi:hypothetical protein
MLKKQIINKKINRKAKKYEAAPNSHFLFHTKDVKKRQVPQRNRPCFCCSSAIFFAAKAFLLQSARTLPVKKCVISIHIP